MLKPDVAQERLQEWRVSEQEGRYLDDVKSLAAKLRPVAYALLDRDAEGNEFDSEKWRRNQRLQRAAMAGLDDFSAKDRAKLFGLFFPQFADEVEAAWLFLKKTPYQCGYTRKAFRAPADPAATRESRLAWLKSLIEIVDDFHAEVVTVPWLAAWATYLGGYRGEQDTVGRLAAAVIDGGGPLGDEVFEILCQSARGEHEIGGMGRHVTRGLLLASRPAGWELVEKMLLAAQRQEGLRQTIVETIDEAHPAAFRRMLRLLSEHDLVRFSSVVRAINVWLGYQWDSISSKVVSDVLEKITTLLDDDAARCKALAGSDAESAYLALWSTAFDDAPASVSLATGLLGHKKVEMRFVAALHLSRLGLPQAHPPRVQALDDDDLRVTLVALGGLGTEEDEVEGEADGEGDPGELRGGDRQFDALERLIARVPEKPVKLKPLVWPWTERTAKREEVARYLVDALGNRPPTRLIPYLAALKPWTRSRVVEMLSEQKKWDRLTRGTLLDLAGDGSADVRKAAIGALAKKPLEPSEPETLESLLTRKTSDLRRGVIDLLVRQGDDGVLASAERLITTSDGSQRLAGLELLRLLAESDRQRQRCLARATTFQSERKKLTKDEETQLAAIAASGVEKITLDNALGLLDPSQRSPAVAPKKRPVQFITPAALACLKALDDLVHEHREQPIKLGGWQRGKESLLGAADYGFPSPTWTTPVAKGASKLPLREVWEAWFANRSSSERDPDGAELMRAFILLEFSDEWDWKNLKQWAGRSAERKVVLTTMTGGQQPIKLRYQHVVRDLLLWLEYLHPEPRTADFLLDAVETMLTLVPADDMKELAKPRVKSSGYHYAEDDDDWRSAKLFDIWFDQLQGWNFRHKLSPEQTARRWQLMRWRDEPFAGARRRRPDLDVLLAAYDHGAATLADLADHCLGPQREGKYSGESFDALERFTARKLSKEDAAFLERHPEVRDLVERCRSRILEIELARGDSATAATSAAHSIKSLWGTDTLLRLMTALGKQGFKPATGWSSDVKLGRLVTLTELASNTYPLDGDSPEQFADRVRAAIAAGHVPEERVLQLAFLSPQWSKYVEQFFAWDGFAEGLYWFLAHMKYAFGATEQAAVGAGYADDEPTDADETDADDSSDDAAEKPAPLSAWDRLILERTPITDNDRRAGAVDVGWFRRTFEQLGSKRWLAMAEAAKFAANTSQAKRAQFIADVLLGRSSRKELFHGVRVKKLKEYVRLLGLYPLATGAKRDADLTERYAALQEYKRYARQLSSMTKPEALRSLDVGMRNLANTAGYPDPLRLEWAMEAENVADLAKGPVSVTKAGVTVTLALDENALPQMTVCRGEKPLKSIPPAIKKDKKVAALADRVTDLKRQSSRMKQSLEAAMCRGDTFTGAELTQLCNHAILAPLLERLVLVGEGICGYPDKRGRVLRDHRGKFEPVKKNEPFRIAHPHDLLSSAAWSAWQHDCFAAERVQPFKQIFRELYVVTKQEQRDGTQSNRYAGQQVNPKQAYALWGQRGWNTQDGVFKTFHDEGLTVSVSFNYGITTPLDVEGLTLDAVHFQRRDESKPLKLSAVPPRIFSEVMRDIDLVVSVAHRGGVDPEASASTVEMRASLLRETCELLQLKNVRVKNSHVLIDGELANYSVHLGSATVHRLPGGSVCIVPVHSQHRGRLFLPFADDDPRTAEVIAKVILLARDHEIQDPTILEQLRR